MEPKCKLQTRSLITRAAEDVFDWHLRPRMFERCIPSWEKITVLSSEGRPNQVGSRILLKVKFFSLFSSTLELEYTHFVKNESFSIDLSGGIIGEGHYKTEITPQSPHTSEIIGRFAFSHSYPQIFSPLIHREMKTRLSRLLAYKHELIDHDIGTLKKYPFEKPFKILISGSHGLIGKQVAYFLEFAGHDVWHLSRQGGGEEKSVIWDPKTGKCQLCDFEGFDVVIHLAGENIAKGWWTKKKKKRMLESRAKGTENLVSVLKQLNHPPEAFISASAIGYYGNRGDEVVNETSGPGRGLFITKICEEWERAGKELEEKGIRVAHTRFGVVLSSAGGALKKMLLPFKWGLGGKIGDGHQYVSWVAIDDVVGALYHVMMTPTIHGAVNVVSPNPVPNDILAKKLAKRLKRWVGPPLPELAVRLLMGQKGEELLLTSTRAEPRCLSESGYTFHYPELSQALKHVI